MIGLFRQLGVAQAVDAQVAVLGFPNGFVRCVVTRLTLTFREGWPILPPSKGDAFGFSSSPYGAGSSNGRTADSGSAYWGSNPCPAAIRAMCKWELGRDPRWTLSKKYRTGGVGPIV